MGGSVDDGRVHDLARPALGAGVLERREHSDDEIERTARVVADEVGGDGGRLVGLADHAEGAGDGDVGDVVAGALGEGSFLAPAGHPAVHQPRVARQALLRSDSEPFGDAGPEALNEDVGPFGQVQDLAGAVLGLEVDQHRALVAVGEVVRRVDAQPRAARPVHPYDIGAEVGEDHGGERAGTDTRQLDHAYPDQWAVPCHCHQAPSTVTQLM
jgi:hypothetical protein